MNNILQKVKHASLAMQRYSWEQGVVAQAFLESKDYETHAPTTSKYTKQAN